MVIAARRPSITSSCGARRAGRSRPWPRAPAASPGPWELPRVALAEVAAHAHQRQERKAPAAGQREHVDAVADPARSASAVHRARRRDRRRPAAPHLPPRWSAPPIAHRVGERAVDEAAVPGVGHIGELRDAVHQRSRGREKRTRPDQQNEQYETGRGGGRDNLPKHSWNERKESVEGGPGLGDWGRGGGDHSLAGRGGRGQPRGEGEPNPFLLGEEGEAGEGKRPKRGYPTTWSPRGRCRPRIPRVDGTGSAPSRAMRDGPRG